MEKGWLRKRRMGEGELEKGWLRKRRMVEEEKDG